MTVSYSASTPTKTAAMEGVTFNVTSTCLFSVYFCCLKNRQDTESLDHEGQAACPHSSVTTSAKIKTKIFTHVKHPMCYWHKVSNIFKIWLWNGDIVWPHENKMANFWRAAYWLRKQVACIGWVRAFHTENHHTLHLRVLTSTVSVRIRNSAVFLTLTTLDNFFFTFSPLEEHSGQSNAKQTDLRPATYFDTILPNMEKKSVDIFCNCDRSHDVSWNYQFYVL